MFSSGIGLHLGWSYGGIKKKTHLCIMSAVLAIFSYLGFNDMSDLGILFSNYICKILYCTIRVERFRGVFKIFLKCNRQELPKVVPHQNEETPKFF